MVVDADDVLVLEVLHRAPAFAEAGGQGSGNAVEIDERVAAVRRLRQRGADGLAQRAGDDGVEPGAAFRARAHRRPLVGPVLRNQGGVRLHGPQRVRQALQEPPPAVGVDHRHLVEPEPVGVVLVDEEPRVVPEEPANLSFPIGEHEAARPPLVGEVEAPVVVSVRLPVEEIDALVAEIAAGMVVHDVENDGDAVDVEQVDDGHQLGRLAAELAGLERRPPARHEQLVRLRDVAGEVGIGGRHGVVHLRRVVVRAVVAERARGAEFLHRQELHGVDAKVGQVLDPEQQVKKPARPIQPAIPPSRVGRAEGPDMQLVQHEVVEGRRLEARIVPGKGLRAREDAVAVRERGSTVSARV